MRRSMLSLAAPRSPAGPLALFEEPSSETEGRPLTSSEGRRACAISSKCFRSK